MVNSFGFYVYNKNKERILNPNLRDPYFKNSSNDSNVWTKWTGYILPLYMSDSNSDSQPDSQFDETNGVDWKWPRDAKYVALRFGSCGSDSKKSGKAFVRRHIVSTMPTSRNSDSVEPTKDVDVEPTKDVDVEPTKDVDVEPTKDVDVEPTKDVDVEPTKDVDVEPTKDVDVEPTSDDTASGSPKDFLEVLATDESNTVPSIPAVNKTWYLNLSFREFETPQHPEHVVWTFNISDFREWESKPNDTKGN